MSVIRMPFFRYHLMDIRNPNYLWITHESEKLVKVKNPSEFYALCGYTTEMSNSGIEADYFIWQEYTKDNSIKAAVCLQAIIIDYLNINSPKFRKEYADAYEGWRGTCTSDKQRDSLDCISCKMHKPSQTYI